MLEEGQNVSAETFLSLGGNCTCNVSPYSPKRFRGNVSCAAMDPRFLFSPGEERVRGSWGPCQINYLYDHIRFLIQTDGPIPGSEKGLSILEDG